MQNSTTTVVRAAVMLGCLIAIPGAALLGTSLPELVDSIIGVIDRENVSSAGTDRSLSEAPRYGLVVQPGNLSSTAGTRSNDPSRDSAGFGQSAPRFQLAQSPTVPIAQNTIPVGLAASPPPSSYPVTTYPSSTQIVSLESAENAPNPNIAPNPASGQMVPVDYQAAPSYSPPVKPAVATRSETASDQFKDVQQRLRQLGATYYLLEAWGNQGHLYRFYCKMSVRGNPNYNRHFEATDASAIKAMSKVLAEVEMWRRESASSDAGRQ